MQLDGRPRSGGLASTDNLIGPDFWQTLVEQSPVAAAVIATDGSFVYGNAAAERLYGVAEVGGLAGRAAVAVFRLDTTWQRLRPEPPDRLKLCYAFAGRAAIFDRPPAAEGVRHPASDFTSSGVSSCRSGPSRAWLRERGRRRALPRRAGAVMTSRGLADRTDPDGCPSAPLPLTGRRALDPRR